jgi:hypothetical protein
MTLVFFEFLQIGFMVSQIGNDWKIEYQTARQASPEVGFRILIGRNPNNSVETLFGPFVVLTEINFPGFE